MNIMKKRKKYYQATDLLNVFRAKNWNKLQQMIDNSRSSGYHDISVSITYGDLLELLECANPENN